MYSVYPLKIYISRPDPRWLIFMTEELHNSFISKITMNRFPLKIKFRIYCIFVLSVQSFSSHWMKMDTTFLVWHRHYAGYKQGDPGYGAKSLAELENQRNNDQQGANHSQSGQLYSPSPARKGDSSLSGQKGSDTSGMSSSGKDKHWPNQYMLVRYLDRTSLKMSS